MSKTHPKLGCEGKIGEYLEKGCSKYTKKCIFIQNKKVVEKIKSVEFRNSDLTIKANLKLNDPFILALENPNQVTLNLLLFKTTSQNVNIKNIQVKEFRLLNSKSEILGSVNFNDFFKGVGSKLQEKKISLREISKYESRELVKLELDVNYVKEILNSKGEVVRTENKIETLKSGLGSWTFINPNFYENKK